MKIVAILLVLTVLAAGTAMGYMYMSSNVSIDGVNVVAVDAAGQAQLFENLKRQVEDGSLMGTPFHTENIGDAEDYVFYRYTVGLKNNTAVDADVVELQVTPIDADVLQMGDTERHMVKAGQTGEASGILLTRKETRNVRELAVSFYIWGLPFVLKTTYGQ